MRKTSHKLALALLALGMLVSCWTYIYIGYHNIRPVGHRLGDLILQVPELKLYKFTYNGNAYFKGVGRIKPLLVLPSGPPAYVFDAEGRLVDWVSDVGDSPQFVQKWGGFNESIPVEKDVAIKFINENKSAISR